MDKQRFEPPAPCELAPDIPDDLNALCVDLLRRDPEARPAGREVLRRLGSSYGRAEARRSRSRRRRISRAAWSAAPAISSAWRPPSRTMCRGRTVACLHPRPFGGRQDRPGPPLPRRSDRPRRGRRPGGPVLRAGVGALQGPRQRRRRPEPATSKRPAARGGAGAAAPRHPIAGPGLPALGEAEAVATAPRLAAEVPDPQELRRRAFGALRELLARLGDRRPLVLAIDDLQWGDSDSAALLSELLRPPDAPRLLLLGCYRSEDAATSPLLRALLEADEGGGPASTVACWPCGTLEPAEAEDLALTLLGREDQAAVRPRRGHRPRVGG